MFHLVKLVFLLSILSGTANAQWGAVVAQPDTNRFINSQQDFGLIMPHQQVIVGLLDTAITSVGIGGGNAFKVIAGSLLDYEDNCVNYTIINGVASCDGSYELWREMEKSTGWYQAARGDTTAMFPTNYAVTISTGQDSVNIWNRDTAELWMAFKVASGNHIFTGTQKEIEFKDGKLYSASTGGLFVEDFLTERASIYNVGGFAIYEGGFQSRNKGGTGLFLTYSTAIALSNSSTNAIAVTRDPFGLKDDLGRPAHWWVTGGAGTQSTYNPHVGLIYDSTWSGTQMDIATSSRGSGLNIRDETYDEIIYNYTILDRVADAYGRDNTYSSNSAGGKDLVAMAFNYAAIIEGKSIVGSDGDIAVVGSSDGGLYNLHQPNPYVGLATGGARQRFSATVNAPVEFGNAVLALALENNTTDSSPYGNTMSVNGTVNTSAAVFGNGGNFTVGGSIEHAAATGLTGVGWGVSGGNYAMGWFKRASVATTAGETIIDISNNGSSPQFVVEAPSTNQTFRIRYHNGSSTDDITTIDFCDGEWHHLAFLRDVDNNNQLFYLDGVLSGSDNSLVAAGATTNDDIMFGANGTTGGGTNAFAVFELDDWTVGLGNVSAEAIAKIHAEGRKKLNMGTPVFTRTTDDAFLSNNVIDIDALDNGIWAVVFSDAATAQVFDGRIPIQQIAAPAGTVKSVALIQSPGTDSVGVVIGTSANLKYVQPSVNLRMAMAHQYEEPIFVGQTVMVDSAGIDGIFWSGDDGIDAGFNAGRTFIKLGRGTFGPFDVDHPGMIIEGSGWGNVVNATDHTYGGTIINGTGVGDPIDVALGAHSIIRDLAVFSEGGEGGSYSGIHVTSSYVTIDNITVIDSDSYGIELASNFGLVTNSHFYDADGWSTVMTTACCNGIIDNLFKDCTNGIYSYVSDDNIFLGNHHKDCGQFVQIDAGSNYNLIVGNRYEGGYVDSGTGNVFSGNEGTAH